MRQDPGFLAIVVFLVVLLGIAIALVLIRIHRLRHGIFPHCRDRQEYEQGISDTSSRKEEPYPLRRATIIDQLNSIEEANKKQMQSIIAMMVESHDWQSLGQQLNWLFDKQLEHLRALAKRHNSTLSTEGALHHTLEAFRISCLILSLYEALVAESDIVMEILDEWFQTQRGMTISQFYQKIHSDCARILLLDLDYASPPRDTILAQLDMAEEFCIVARSPDNNQRSPSQLLLSEIALRKERLSK